VTINIVSISMSFSPNPVSLRVGQQVIWRNTDSITHTASSGSFDTGTVGPGAMSKPITMTAAGTFPYQCNIHPSMKGTLNVTP
jgi:plastocyanin